MAKRSAAHTKAQKSGKDRDLNICQICGSKEEVEGHHVIDYQFAGSADMDNIISLCHRCHMEVHSGKVDLFKF